MENILKFKKQNSEPASDNLGGVEVKKELEKYYYLGRFENNHIQRHIRMMTSREVAKAKCPEELKETADQYDVVVLENPDDSAFQHMLIVHKTLDPFPKPADVETGGMDYIFSLDLIFPKAT